MKDFLLVLLGIPTSILIRGWAMSILWGWFMVGGLHAPYLRIPYALGISALVSMMINTKSNRDQVATKDSPNIVQAIAEGIGTPLFMLLIGWIVKLFI